MLNILMYKKLKHDEMLQIYLIFIIHGFKVNKKTNNITYEGYK